MDELHRELGGRMVPFAGWEMPVMYESIMVEHQAVRESAGVFDISHMGQIFVEGSGAEGFLEKMLTNEVGQLADGQAQYTFLLNEEGGVIDDLILYRLAEGSYLLVVNASRIAEDRDWLQARLPKKVELREESGEWAGMAVQGPDAAEIYGKVTGGRTLPPRNGIDDLQHEGERVVVCRTGYTGEDGFELFCPAKAGAKWFRNFVDAGVKPCGLGARDTLRLEMCYPLNGQDLSDSRTPLEAGLGFFVALEKGDFTGAEVLRRQKEEGLTERLFALQSLTKGAPPRPGYPVCLPGGEAIGELSSGGLAPSLGLGVGLAYLPKNEVKIGTALELDVRGRRVPVKVVKKPFYQAD
ncbi:MAG: glycine cleavage system aminomethyltransferase GcvT [Verrucomicrobiales bacterium]